MPWRAKVSSLNLLITSTVWRQDHNGFSHQDPGLLDVVANKSPEVVRVYLPPDANCLLSVGDHCLRSTGYVNVIVADKQPHLQYLDMDAAVRHCTKGIGIWDWASNDQGAEPDVVMASCGDVATMEALAATELLREHFPGLKVRFVNVVDLFRLVPEREHPHGLSDREFESLFTPDRPVIFNFHSYPWLIHRLTYRRGTSTTSTSGATRSRGTSTRRWSWRSATRSTGSAWRSTRSTGCRRWRRSAPTPASGCSTARSVPGVRLRARHRPARGRPVALEGRLRAPDRTATRTRGTEARLDPCPKHSPKSTWRGTARRPGRSPTGTPAGPTCRSPSGASGTRPTSATGSGG